MALHLQAMLFPFLNHYDSYIVIPFIHSQIRKVEGSYACFWLADVCISPRYIYSLQGNRKVPESLHISISFLEL
jgi:hypothetical protein